MRYGSQRTVKHYLLRPEKDIVSSITRRSYNAAAMKILRHKNLRPAIMRMLGRDCRAQLAHITSERSSSLILRSDPTAIRAFSWAALSSDLQQHCGALFSLLLLMVPTKKREQAMEMVALIVSMLAKMWNKKACFAQTIVSLMLFAGHTSNQVPIRCMQDTSQV